MRELEKPATEHFMLILVIMTDVCFTERQATSKLQQSDRHILAISQMFDLHIPVTFTSNRLVTEVAGKGRLVTLR